MKKQSVKQIKAWAMLSPISLKLFSIGKTAQIFSSKSALRKAIVHRHLLKYAVQCTITIKEKGRKL